MGDGFALQSYLRLQTLFYIREARTLEGPAERSADWSPVDSACRPSLPADASEWAGGQGGTGVSQQLVFDDGAARCRVIGVKGCQLQEVTSACAVHDSAGEWLVTDDVTLAVADGGIAISAEEAAAFEPPSSSLRITRLPDAMYMAYPGDLRSSAQALPSMSWL